MDASNTPTIVPMLPGLICRWRNNTLIGTVADSQPTDSPSGDRCTGTIIGTTGAFSSTAAPAPESRARTGACARSRTMTEKRAGWIPDGRGSMRSAGEPPDSTLRTSGSAAMSSSALRCSIHRCAMSRAASSMASCTRDSSSCRLDRSALRVIHRPAIASGSTATKTVTTRSRTRSDRVQRITRCHPPRGTFAATARTARDRTSR